MTDRTPVLDDIHAPLDLTPGEIATIRDLLESVSFGVGDIRAAHLYTRKDYLTTSDFASTTRPAGRSDRDDIVIQVNLTIPSFDRRHEDLSAIYARIQETKRQEAIAAHEARVAQAEAALAAAQAELDTLRGHNNT